MKKPTLFIVVAIIFGQLYAQNPFKELGIKDSIQYLTLSDGRYDEFHNYNDFEKVGSAIIDMRTNKIVRFFSRDSIHEVGMYELDMTTRFMTTDAMAEKYYELNPYQYGANNPILFIDVNGDSISANSGGQNYHYGYNEKTGYGMYDKNGQLYVGNDKTLNAVNSALASLSLGKEGKQLVDILAGAAQNINFNVTSGKNQAVFSGSNMSVDWNPNSTTLIPTQDGGKVSPSFISLGHEMAHIEDALNKTYNGNTWETITDPNTGSSYNIPNAELYSTHVENLLRSENGLPLRTYYGAYTDGRGISQTRLIKGNTSLFIQLNGTTNYNKITDKNLRYGYK